MGIFGKIGKIITAGTVGEDEFESMIPGIGDAQAQDKANQTNIGLAEANRKWSEHMSNTAYQRAMDDMKKAGLNPILAYQQGGASVPSVGAATVNPSSKTGLTNAAVSAYTGISAAGSQAQQANTAQAQSESTISLQAASTANQVAQVEKTKAETAKVIDSIKNQKVQRQLLSTQVPLEQTKAAASELALKGSQRAGNMFDKMLKTTAKPSVDSKTLQYKNPLNPMNWFDDKKQQKPASSSGSY